MHLLWSVVCLLFFSLSSCSSIHVSQGHLKCHPNTTEGCFLEACTSDKICYSTLGLRLGENRHNCFQIEMAVADLVSNKILASGEAHSLCASNQTHAAYALRLYFPCPIGYVYSAHKRLCICHVDGFCGPDAFSIASGSSYGKFTLWFFGSIFVVLVGIVFYQLFYKN